MPPCYVGLAGKIEDSLKMRRHIFCRVFIFICRQVFTFIDIVRQQQSYKMG